jgi:hypothetical protein
MKKKEDDKTFFFSKLYFFKKIFEIGEEKKKSTRLFLISFPRFHSKVTIPRLSSFVLRIILYAYVFTVYFYGSQFHGLLSRSLPRITRKKKVDDEITFFFQNHIFLKKFWFPKKNILVFFITPFFFYTFSLSLFQRLLKSNQPRKGFKEIPGRHWCLLDYSSTLTLLFQFISSYPSEGF